jgi:plasmid stabilization system protein ParE
MSYAVHILDRAWSDVDCIYDWIAARSPIGAARWYAAFRAATSDLSDDPHRHGFAPEDELVARQVRQRFFKTRRGRVYRLLFVVSRDEVRVLRIYGPGQAPASAQDVDIE